MNQPVQPSDEKVKNQEPSQERPVQTRPDNLPARVAVFYESTSWDEQTKRTALVVMLVVAGILFWMSRPVLPVLIVAFMVSYLLSPIVDLLERIRIPRGLSTLILYLLLLVAMIFAPILLVPILIQQLSDLIVVDVQRTTQMFVVAIQEWVNNLPTEIEILGFSFTLDGIVQQVQTAVNGDLGFQVLPSARDLIEYFNRLIITATNVVGGTAAIGFTLVGGLLNALLFMLFLFFLSLYMTKDAPKIRRYIQGLFPESYHTEASELLRQMGHIWQAFFRGQLLLSLIIGVVTWGVLRLLGMPGALILGIIAGSLEIIPTVGPVLAMIPAVIVALIQGSTVLEIGNFEFALLIVGVYFVVQQLENQLLVPRIIGTSVNLHPIVVLCGVVVGASMGGLLGAFLAAPIIATLRVVGSYVHAKLLDHPPFLNAKLAAETHGEPFVYRRVVIPSEEPDEDEEREEDEEASSVHASRSSGDLEQPATR
jgi:predicted PurR-regulated permease PerM